MRSLNHCAVLWLISITLLTTVEELAAQTPDLSVGLADYDGPASVTSKFVGRYKLRIDVDPATETKDLAIRVELPATGRNRWPIAAVEVRDARGEAVVVTRSGIEWHKLLIPVPVVRHSYFVQAIDSSQGELQLTTEKERRLVDSKTGLRAAVTHWYDGRQSALSLRFDDSHPTHLTKAVPILNEYGFRGTFMINPGASEPGSTRHMNFQLHRAQWEAVAKSGKHEFANHSAHHRGARSDEDMEAEIGDAAQVIWKMTPGQSKLLALNLGGGTRWATSRTLRYYLDKFFHFDASSGSLGMDDAYGNRVIAFRRHLNRHVESRGWCRVHFHYIGEGLSSSEEHFRAALDIAKENRAAIWIAGMADIYKYQTERNHASLSPIESNDSRLKFALTTRTAPELYDQELTIEVTPPSDWPADRIAVSDVDGKAVAHRLSEIRKQTVLRFDVPPRTADYTIELRR